MRKPERRVFEVRVPATTANLGPGFDSLGLAMRIYNKVTVTIGGEEGMEITGEGADTLPRDETNLMVRSAMILAEQHGMQLPPIYWKAHHDIPLARGMGSSSAAIVAGLAAAREALGLDMDWEELGPFATDIEGHPDNVVPAIVGGLTVIMAGAEEDGRVLALYPNSDLRLVLLVPDYELSTDEMRKALPKKVAHGDAVFNLARTPVMVIALERGMWGMLREACRDKIHQPYRLPHMKGMEAVFEAAYKAGAHGVAVSGSGPTIVAFCTRRVKAVAAAMLDAAQSEGVEATTIVTRPDLEGATVTRKE